ncbi:eCIS core domain-containing protein [Nostoc sp.]|uniref:eCIS core domain-containing protein n=1 Tax=Nostoc sp. TaxID=1180 RepID=UPI002FF9EC66
MSGRSQVEMLRQLQRSYGNSYVGSVIQRKADGSGSCSECEKKEKEIQRKGEGDVSSVPDGFEPAMQRSGSRQPLDQGTRSFMESRFGQDFGEVKIHTDSAAAEASEAVRAQAFTTGRDIYFGRGRYQPHYTEGKKLLAHELAHTIQQKNLSGVQTKLDISSPSDSLEQAADDTAAKVLSKGMDQVYKEYSSLSKTTSSLLTTPLIQRDFDPLAVGMTNPKVPASISVPSQNASYVTLAQASVSSTVVYDGLTLSTDSVQLDKTLGEIIKKSGKQALEGFRENLAATFANSPKFAEIAGTLLPKQESSSEAWPIVNKVLNLAIERANEILKSVEEFLEDFEKNAKTATYKILEESENQIKAEQKKYGITRTFEPAYTKLGVFLTGQNPQIPKYSVENNPESQDMAKAAADLATKRLEIKGLIQKQKALVQEVPFYMGHGKYISNQQEYDDLEKQIEEANRSYYLLRYDKESKFPILSTYAEDNESNIKILTAIGKGIMAAAKPFDNAGSSTGVEYLAAQTFEKLENIQKVREALGANKVKILKNDNILKGTKATMGLKPDSIEDRLVDDHAKQVASEEFWENLLIAAVAIGLGLVAAIPSGGSSIVVAGITTAAAIAGAGLSVYQAGKSLKGYELARAESGTHFDKAQAISQEEPSLFWLGVDIIGAGLDIAAALKAFRSLAPLTRAALIDEAGAAERLIKRGNEVKGGLGDRIAQELEAAKSGKGAKGIGTAAEEFKANVIEKEVLEKGGSIAPEISVAEGHGLILTKDGRIFRCSKRCADLHWLFQRLLEERPDIAKDLEKIAQLPVGERISAARAFYEKAKGLTDVIGLSDAELAERIAKSEGTLAEEELKYERYRREGGNLPFDQKVASDLEATAQDLQVLDPIQSHRLLGEERHHPFFKYLLRAIKKATPTTSKRLNPQKLVDLPTGFHQEMIHEFWNQLFPNLASAPGASKRISGEIISGAIKPEEIVNNLKDFYRLVLADSPKLDEVLKSIDSLIRRTGI